MTYNVKLRARNEVREHILEHIKQFSEVLVAENTWFNGKYGGRQIIGLGFQTEEDRDLFLLEFKLKDMCSCTLTDKSFKWGYDHGDIDF